MESALWASRFSSEQRRLILSEQGEDWAELHRATYSRRPRDLEDDPIQSLITRLHVYQDYVQFKIAHRLRTPTRPSWIGASYFTPEILSFSGKRSSDADSQWGPC
jgi:hypothetical protein